MTASDAPPPIEYDVFAAFDAEPMARLLGDVFSRRDPPAFAVGLTAAEFEAFVRALCPRAAAERLTIVARLAGTGELVGALLTQDAATDAFDGVEALSPRFAPILDIIGQLEPEDQYEPPAPGVSLHLLLLGVADSVSGRGVAQRLVRECIERGSKCGYRVAVTEATNPVSQRVFRKLGFVERTRRSYGEYRFEGRAVFSSIAELGGPMLMERSLTG
ncbi:MAG: GNAT family N-acetyltransferase [Syntrophomonadaceae bacterium]